MNTRDKKPTGFQLNPDNINRKGRPKVDDSWAGILRRIGQSNSVHVILKDREGKEKEFFAEAPEGKTIKEAVAGMLYASALNGNHVVANLIMERTEGKVAEAVKLLPPEKPKEEFDYSRLKPDELRLLQDILSKARINKNKKNIDK